MNTATRALTSLARQVSNAGKEAVHRTLAAPTIIRDLLGTRSRMTMRLRVVILRDEDGTPVADAAAVMPSIIEAQGIFLRDTNIDIVPFDEGFIQTAPHAAPATALDVSCGAGAYTADLGTAGAYFSQHSAQGNHNTTRGAAAPVTVFIVRTMTGANGCALGPIATYATVSTSGLQSRVDRCRSGSARTAHRVLAHELGHVCGLLHSSDCQDLMYSSAGQRFTKTSQVLAVRSSRFVKTR